MDRFVSAIRQAVTVRQLPVLAVLLASIITVAPGSVAEAAPPADKVHWQRDVKQAGALSVRSGRPILVQVTASWCGWCHRMLETTFQDDTVARRVNEDFVPLLIDADQHEDLVEAIGIQSFPSTIIISSDLDVLGRIEGFHKTGQYLDRLAPYCHNRRRTTAASIETTSQPSAAASAGDSGTRLTSALAPVGVPAPLPVPIDARLAPQPARAAQSQPGTLPLQGLHESGTQGSAAHVAFSGACLVSLLEDRRHLPGDPAIVLTHGNIVLQFASAAKRDAFAAAPDRYWPLADGRCPVAMSRGDKDVAGDVRTAAVFRGHLVMFRSLQHRQTFATAPDRFAAALEPQQQAAR